MKSNFNFLFKLVKESMLMTTDTRDQLTLFTKLFVIMGLPWFSVCIHIMIHGDHTQNDHCSLYIEVPLP